MAVKHMPTGVTHKGNRGGTTGCGIDTSSNTNNHKDHWVASSQKITCDKNGCKGQPTHNT